LGKGAPVPRESLLEMKTNGDGRVESYKKILYVSVKSLFISSRIYIQNIKINNLTSSRNLSICISSSHDGHTNGKSIKVVVLLTRACHMKHNRHQVASEASLSD
jgi:hypothetical protein